MGRLKDQLSHAFAVDPPGPAEPTPLQQGPIDRVCRAIAKKHLATPGLMMLEMARPLNWVGAQALHVLGPAVWAIARTETYDGYQALVSFLEQRGSLEYMARRVEHFEAEFQVKRREARAAAEGKKGMTVKSEPIEEDHDQDRS
ncbi:MAG: hypothetical protein ACYTF9_08160 [Planctomycetota bacterium]